MEDKLVTMFHRNDCNDSHLTKNRKWGPMTGNQHEILVFGFCIDVIHEICDLAMS